ncbi:MAG: hypothetical protein DME25_04290 [Verrucomicrobia bacterium]|nr:MAG: hypothetical protein DME25_04290 [Verrucomicrobiota bacterium]
MIQRLSLLALPDREKEIVSQVMAGDVPNFLRRHRPVQVTNVYETGSAGIRAGSKTNTATFYVPKRIIF